MEEFEELVEKARLSIEAEMGATGLADIKENANDPLVMIVVTMLRVLHEMNVDFDDFKKTLNPKKLKCGSDSVEVVANLMGLQTGDDAGIFSGVKNYVTVATASSENVFLPKGIVLFDSQGNEWTTSKPLNVVGNNQIHFVQALNSKSSHNLSLGELVLDTMNHHHPLTFMTNSSTSSSVYSVNDCHSIINRLQRLGAGWNIAESPDYVINRLLDIEGVTYAAFVSFPMGSFAFIVHGGSNQDVSNVIIESSPVGYSRLTGNEFIDNNGRTVGILRPLAVIIDVFYGGSNVDHDTLKSIICDRNYKDSLGQKEFINIVPGLTSIKFDFMRMPKTVDEPMAGLLVEDCLGEVIDDVNFQSSSNFEDDLLHISGDASGEKVSDISIKDWENLVIRTIQQV